MSQMPTPSLARLETPDGLTSTPLPLKGRSPAVADVLSTLSALAPTKGPVVIFGEKGTGRELVARALHDRSASGDGPFLRTSVASKDGGALQRDLFGALQRDLFGALEPGSCAAPGGWFGAACGGTLYLKDLEEMPLEAQARLIQVLDAQEGATGPRTRLAVGAPPDMGARIEAGRFRADLFDRLNGASLFLPPLRDRLVDLPDLVTEITASLRGEGRDTKALEGEALKALAGYDWPGNIRELVQFIRYLNDLYRDEPIGAAIVDAELSRKARLGDRSLGVPAVTREASSMTNKDNMSAAIEGHLRRYFARHGDDLPPPGLYDRIIQEVERPLIELCLAATHGNQVKASLVLGLNRNTLRKKIKELGIKVRRVET